MLWFFPSVCPSQSRLSISQLGVSSRNNLVWSTPGVLYLSSGYFILCQCDLVFRNKFKGNPMSVSKVHSLCFSFLWDSFPQIPTSHKLLNHFCLLCSVRPLQSASVSPLCLSTFSAESASGQKAARLQVSPHLISFSLGSQPHAACCSFSSTVIEYISSW